MFLVNSDDLMVNKDQVSKLVLVEHWGLQCLHYVGDTQVCVCLH